MAQAPNPASLLPESAVQSVALDAAPRVGRIWQLRRIDAASHAGYSRRVAILRKALPVLALATLVVLVLWPKLAPHKLIALPPLPAALQLTMEHPRFTGTDDQNQPFSLSAERALQNPSKLTMVDLEGLRAETKLNDGFTVEGSAQIGRFDQTLKRLWLGGNVDIDHGQGYRFTAREMNIDFTKQIVWSDRGAKLEGDFGSVEGQGFRAYEGGKIIIFTGKSRAILNSDDVSGASPVPPSVPPAR